MAVRVGAFQSSARIIERSNRSIAQNVVATLRQFQSSARIIERSNPQLLSFLVTTKAVSILSEDY